MTSEQAYDWLAPKLSKPEREAIEVMRAENERLRTALTEIRDRIKAHPMYADLTQAEEQDIGGDAAELSYLARVADDALRASRPGAQ